MERKQDTYLVEENAKVQMEENGASQEWATCHKTATDGWEKLSDRMGIPHLMILPVKLTHNDNPER